MKYTILILLISFFGTAQTSSKKQLEISSNKNMVLVNYGEKSFTYDFLLPDAIALKSYFLSSENNTFYIKYEYSGSAKSIYFDLAKFKWDNGKIYLTEYIVLNNQTGIWSGVIRLLNNKQIQSFDEIETILFSVQTDNKNIKVVGTTGETVIQNIPKQIENIQSIEDRILIELLRTAKDFVK
jgi:hypothetical protein